MKQIRAMINPSSNQSTESTDSKEYGKTILGIQWSEWI